MVNCKTNDMNVNDLLHNTKKKTSQPDFILNLLFGGLVVFCFINSGLEYNITCIHYLILLNY